MQRLLQHGQVQKAGRAAVVGMARHLNHHLVRGMADPDIRPDVGIFATAAPWTMTQDHVRQATLALLCQEMVEGSVPGAIAEWGVFRGDFAWLMSHYLPDRRVHLFDTFESFDSADVRVEQDAGIVDDFIDSSDTHPDAVLKRFPCPELVTLHPRRFPDTADSVDDAFALVSIVAGPYSPVLSGFDWFYRRLAPGRCHTRARL